MSESISELQATEQMCLQKFRAKALKLMAQNPAMSKKAAFVKAGEQMPQTRTLYMAATQRLLFMGIDAASLR
jgi:hypothetical protein